MSNISNLKIREYKPSDRMHILQMMKEFSQHFVPMNPYKRIPQKPTTASYFTQRTIRSAKNKNGKIYIAEINGEIVGFVGIYLKKQDYQETLETIDMKIGYVSELFVSEKYRRQNIGEKLLLRAEDYFRSKECTHARLTVFGPNTRAHKFYVNHNYMNWDILMIKTL